MKRADDNGKDDLQKQIDISVKKLASYLKYKKKKSEVSTCARCHKQKITSHHHFPLGSHRTVPLCVHCWGVVRKQRARSARFGDSTFGRRPK